MEYPTYKDYKNTRIEFVGDIPKHWEARKLKFMADIENGCDYKHVENSEGFDVLVQVEYSRKLVIICMMVNLFYLKEKEQLMHLFM